MYFNAVEFTLPVAGSSKDESFTKNYNALPKASRSTDIKQRKYTINKDSSTLERPTASRGEPSEKDVCMKRHASTAIRKQFHLLATAILVPGLLFDVNMLKMAAGCALVVLVMLEVRVGTIAVLELSQRSGGTSNLCPEIMGWKVGVHMNKWEV